MSGSLRKNAHVSNLEVGGSRPSGGGEQLTGKFLRSEIEMSGGLRKRGRIVRVGEGASSLVSDTPISTHSARLIDKRCNASAKDTKGGLGDFLADLQSPPMAPHQAVVRSV